MPGEELLAAAKFRRAGLTGGVGALIPATCVVVVTSDYVHVCRPGPERRRVVVREIVQSWNRSSVSARAENASTGSIPTVRLVLLTPEGREVKLKTAWHPETPAARVIELLTS